MRILYLIIYFLILVFFEKALFSIWSIGINISLLAILTLGLLKIKGITFLILSLLVSFLGALFSNFNFLIAFITYSLISLSSFFLFRRFPSILTTMTAAFLYNLFILIFTQAIIISDILKIPLVFINLINAKVILELLLGSLAIIPVFYLISTRKSG